MNEVLHPDWRDPQSYSLGPAGDPSSWTPRQWKWEFFKRRSYFDQRLQNAKYAAVPSGSCDLFADEHDPETLVRFYVGEGKDWFDGGKLREVDLPEGSVAVVFNLADAIEPQIAAARERLMHMRTGPDRRRHVAKYLCYLRVLDARQSGASWAQIALLLPASKGSRSSQDARDVHQQARSLCLEGV